MNKLLKLTAQSFYMIPVSENDAYSAITKLIYAMLASKDSILSLLLSRSTIRMDLIL